MNHVSAPFYGFHILKKGGLSVDSLVSTVEFDPVTRITSLEMHRMKNTNSKLITYFMAFILALGSLSIATSASAGETYDFNHKPGGGDMLLDMVFIRPLMLVSTAAGAVSFVVTLPFSALGGNVGEAAETLVMEPARYTFVRPLGEN
jgi:hypothetical protein